MRMSLFESRVFVLLCLISIRFRRTKQTSVQLINVFLDEEIHLKLIVIDDLFVSCYLVTVRNLFELNESSFVRSYNVQRTREEENRNSTEQFSLVDILQGKVNSLRT